MTDERLAELRADRDAAIDERTALKRRMEDARAQITRMAADVQRLSALSKELAVPYKAATEKVADLAGQIETEERRRAEEAEAKRRAEREAAEKAEAERKAAEDAKGKPKAEV